MALAKRPIPLYTRIFIGLVLGAVVGVIINFAGLADHPWWATGVLPLLEFIGRIFIRLITMLVIPLVVASLLTGVASMGDLRKLGRIGGKTLLYYLLTTALAITIGLSLALLVKPGSRIAPETRDTLAAEFRGDADARIALADERPSTWDVLLNMVPDNPIAAAAQGNLLPLIIFVL
ncbi:MAG: dicarboxylate/amino acid:cation symporter, partial [Thermoanaerobaculia bacterium]